MLKLKIDPWSSDFGPSLHLAEEEAELDVGCDVEGEWRAHDAGSEPLPECVTLVDGVRRMELNLRLEDEVRSMPAAIGSIAVGALRVRWGQAQSLREALLFPEAQAYLLVAATEGPTLPGMTTLCTGEDPGSLLIALQNRMRSLESVVASRAAEVSDLVIADGPLQSTHDLRHPVVGYVKSHHRQLLPRERMELVRLLKPGQRTPIFSLGTSSYDRFSWYLRLDAPQQAETVLAGVVRLEMLASYGLPEAQRRAAQLSQLLPRFANSRHRDARSPQNLIPIAVLEKAMRHRLGDAGLRQRRYRQAVLGESA